MRITAHLRNMISQTSTISAQAYYPASKTPRVYEAVRFPTRRSIPAVWMRAGTSKGLFIHQKDLPKSRELWGPILISAMGSSLRGSRQLDGVGGATSTTSKVAVVAKSSRPDADVDYTFIQVAPDQMKVDATGNCGNMASGVGPFALDEGLVNVRPGQTEIDIRVFNTNTSQIIVETVQISADGSFQESGDYQIPGVDGTSSPIKVAFLNPEGSMTGSMFPSGASEETLHVRCQTLGDFDIRVSLVDAANPFVLVDARSVKLKHPISMDDPSHPDISVMAESIRREGAVRFGLAEDLNAAGHVRGTPKVAFLFPGSDNEDETPKDDLRVLSFTLGKPHPSLQLTGAVCISAAMSIHGTVPWKLSGGATGDTMPKHGMEIGGQDIALPLPVRIRHPSGVIHAETTLGVRQDGDIYVRKVALFRTARRLFDGNVFYKS